MRKCSNYAYLSRNALSTFAYCNFLQTRQDISNRGAEAGQSSPSALSLKTAPRFFS